MENQLADTLLEAADIHAGYGEKKVLHGVSLTLGPAEIVGLLGPNGSGKTTMLKVLCGSLAPTQGSVKIEGKALQGLSYRERARFLGYVPQSEDHAFDFTVRELTMMGRFPYSDGIFETLADHEVCDRSMSECDCLAWADRYVSTLSGGEAQRALVARALAQETPVLLCDEPTTHLDPKHQVSMARLLKNLAKERRGLVVTTHDLVFAAACCDRAIVLKDGKALYTGRLDGDSIEFLCEAFETSFALREDGIVPVYA